ncbi:MAG: hypothetical protein CVV12_00220 [Gammaproteobacteria bacterium HGW-Gammaproteobacteria-2]|jgi:hypothetical protein|nr:MAG: hypothetical protein CVV12_00220 [Gammaproteobacteria bacterium HGW-Gammaproteobacteria-2]
MFFIFVALIIGSAVAGCAATGPSISFEEQYPNAQCRYEATVATAYMGCVGCLEQNIAKFQMLDDIYKQCVALKR